MTIHYITDLIYQSLGPQCSDPGSPNHDSSNCMLCTYYFDCTSGSTNSQVDHAGGVPEGSGMRRTGGVGGTGTGKRPAAGEPWRGRGDQGRKSGEWDGRMTGQCRGISRARENTGEDNTGEFCAQSLMGKLAGGATTNVHREKYFWRHRTDEALGVRNR